MFGRTETYGIFATKKREKKRTIFTNLKIATFFSIAICNFFFSFREMFNKLWFSFVNDRRKASILLIFII